MVCCEVAHKIMRNETAVDLYNSMKRNHTDFQAAFKRSIVGTTVLTDYNNKTYKISDVDFTKSACSTFEAKYGPETYQDYYKKV